MCDFSTNNKHLGSKHLIPLKKRINSRKIENMLEMDYSNVKEYSRISK